MTSRTQAKLILNLPILGAHALAIYILRELAPAWMFWFGSAMWVTAACMVSWVIWRVK